VRGCVCCVGFVASIDKESAGHCGSMPQRARGLASLIVPGIACAG
jgi:hypothetical protein